MMDIEQPISKDSIDMIKVDNLEYCLMNLIAQDITEINDLEKLHSISEANVQLFINRLFSLQKLSDSDGVYVKLPTRAVFPLPRVTPLPKPKPKTRWQLFAESKGIKKMKRSRMVWDDSVKDWVPRWGYKSIKKGLTENPPIYEIKDTEDYNINKFEVESKKRKLAKLKNKYREMRNKMEANGEKPDSTNEDTINPANPELLQGMRGKERKNGMKKILSISQKSDRSCGKHSKKVKGEKVLKSRALGKPKMQSLESESSNYNAIISKVLKQQA